MSLKERREREKEERRKQILDAAKALLFEKGLNATSMNQIAKKAEIGVATIYFYYKSKEDLFAALQVEGLNLLYFKLEKACEKESDPAKKLKTAAQVFLRFSRENKNYFDIINYFLSAPDQIFTPDLKGQIDRHGNIIIEIVEKYIKEGIESRIFKRIDSRRHSVLFWATLYGLTHFKKLKNTVLKGDTFLNLFDYGVDNFISNMTAS
ncbi:MAG: TetR/AcrR family transcriptional regulator [Pseudomonadota bacterium]